MNNILTASKKSKPVKTVRPTQVKNAENISFHLTLLVKITTKKIAHPAPISSTKVDKHRMMNI
jgi:hypothetical protein